MGTLTALLDLSQNALEASQSAIDITSNNVANANTPGYTDEIATWQENDSVTLSSRISAAEGASVSAASQRDPVLISGCSSRRNWSRRVRLRVPH